MKHLMLGALLAGYATLATAEDTQNMRTFLFIGTSNSAAAWFDGSQVRLVQLESHDPIMPTATHLDRELTLLTGEAAVEQYIEENRDRIVELIEDEGGLADHVPSREDCGKLIQSIARPGDRVVVMGARDDTLTKFAEDLLAQLP